MKRSAGSMMPLLYRSARWNSSEAVVEKAVAEGAVKVNELHQLGLGGYSPSGMIQEALYWAESVGGLSWCASIALVAVGIRLTLFPLTLKHTSLTTIQHELKPQLDRIRETAEKYKADGNIEMYRHESSKVMAVMAAKGCSPLKIIAYSLSQMPVILSMFFGLSSLLSSEILSLKYGGMLWFTNLTIPDPYYILPAIVSAIFAVSVEVC